MIQIHFFPALTGISLLWLMVRAAVWIKQRRISLRRDAQLLPVYICLIVVARFTFFPLETVDGVIQPLEFDAAQVLPFRINRIPIVNLLDYDTPQEAWLNLIGNVAMFVPIGIVWPAVFRQLRTPCRAIAAGFGFSLCIEVLQLPFYRRCSDINDLILNTTGFLLGYGIWLLAKEIRRIHKRRVR